MIGLTRLGKLLTTRKFEAAAEEVLANGRRIPIAMRARLLGDEDSAEAVALGLALQRSAEVSGGRAALCEGICQRVLGVQEGSGSFGGIGATAVCVRGLMEHARRTGDGPRVREAIERGLMHLRDVQARSIGTAHEGLIGDEIDAAIVVWQLARERDTAHTLDWRALTDAARGVGLSDEPMIAMLLSELEQDDALVRSGATDTPDRRRAA